MASKGLWNRVCYRGVSSVAVSCCNRSLLQGEISSLPGCIYALETAHRRSTTSFSEFSPMLLLKRCSVLLTVCTENLADSAQRRIDIAINKRLCSCCKCLLGGQAGNAKWSNVVIQGESIRCVIVWFQADAFQPSKDFVLDLSLWGGWKVLGFEEYEYHHKQKWE